MWKCVKHINTSGNTLPGLHYLWYMAKLSPHHILPIAAHLQVAQLIEAT